MHDRGKAFARRVAIVNKKQIFPIAKLCICGNLQYLGAPGLVTQYLEDSCEIFVQKRLTKIEQAQILNMIDVNIFNTAPEIFNFDTAYLFHQGRIGATDATELATMDNIDLKGMETCY